MMQKTQKSERAQRILSQITDKTMLGQLRKMAKEINKDHESALEIWSTGEYLPRLLAILIMDKKRLPQELLDQLNQDMQSHPLLERTNLSDWLMANQLVKDKKNIALIESWERSPLALQRRTFWYYQGRLRWTGKTDQGNTLELLTKIEENIIQEQPEVQWAMNFTAGWIGVYNEKYRARCIELGEKTGLYKEDKVSKGCTPNYLPGFITIEVGKRQKHKSN